jgi:hypothetical protein
MSKKGVDMVQYFHNVMQMHLSEKTRHTKLTDISQELVISLGHARSIIHDQMHYREVLSAKGP